MGTLPDKSFTTSTESFLPMDKNIDLILADADSARALAKSSKKTRKLLLAQVARLEEEAHQVTCDAIDAMDAEAAAYAQLLKDHGSVILTNPARARVAQRVFKHIYENERHARKTPVSNALSSFTQATESVKIGTGIERHALRADVCRADLADNEKYPRIFEFILAFYENYRAYIGPDATLTITTYSMRDSRPLGQVSCVIENVDGKWVSYRDGMGLGTPTADPESLYNTMENILKLNI